MFNDRFSIFFIKSSKIFLHPIKFHCESLYRQLDPIHSYPPSLHSHKPGPISPIRKSQFYFPLFIVLFSALYGTVGLEYESTGTLKGLTDLDAIQVDPYIGTHQISQELIWSQIDFSVGFDVIFSTGIFLALILTQNIPDKFQMVKVGDKVVIGTIELTNEESTKVIKFRKKAKLGASFVCAELFFFCVVYFLANVWFNGVFLTNVRSLVFWILVLPLFVFYLVYALYVLVIFIILTSRYIRVHQQTLLEGFESLNRRIPKLNPSHHHHSRKLTHILYKYSQLNSNLSHLCGIIHEYSDFCAPLLSVIFPYYISVQCYSLYAVTFIDVPMVQKLIFYLVIGECNLFLFVIINECAYVAKYCKAIEVQCRLFYLNVNVVKAFKMNKRSLLKMESFQVNRRLHAFSFHIFGNYRITSKTFYVIISYISAYFMFVFKNSNQYHRALESLKEINETFAEL